MLTYPQVAATWPSPRGWAAGRDIVTRWLRAWVLSGRLDGLSDELPSGVLSTTCDARFEDVVVRTLEQVLGAPCRCCP